MKPLPIQGIDSLEFCVGNARQAAYYYQKAFGFNLVAYAGPETGVRDRASYVLQQGSIRFVLSSALDAHHEYAIHVLRHGDGVRDIVFAVEDVDHCYEEALLRGARGVKEPNTIEDNHGTVRRAAIGTLGDVVHTFIDRSRYSGFFAPGYQAVESTSASFDGAVNVVGLRSIDHVVSNVEEGRMEEWVEFYSRVFGFTQLVSFDDKDISTQYSALRSKVMQNASGTVKLPINEPAAGLRRSQIQEYLEFNGGPGVQHVALATPGIISTVSAMLDRGVPFLKAPPSYYGGLTARVGPIAESLQEIQALGVLADKDEQGYMLQIFTMPVQDRPTLFYEVIQRQGSQSFGKGNFKELFEAIEREQARRGNLESPASTRRY